MMGTAAFTQGSLPWRAYTTNNACDDGRVRHAAGITLMHEPAKTAADSRFRRWGGHLHASSGQAFARLDGGRVGGRYLICVIQSHGPGRFGVRSFGAALETPGNLSISTPEGWTRPSRASVPVTPAPPSASDSPSGDLQKSGVGPAT